MVASIGIKVWLPKCFLTCVLPAVWKSFRTVVPFWTVDVKKSPASRIPLVGLAAPKAPNSSPQFFGLGLRVWG